MPGDFVEHIAVVRTFVRLHLHSQLAHPHYHRRPCHSGDLVHVPYR